MSYWAKTYGEGEAKAVAVDGNGDIIVVGEREGDGFVARLDKDGNVKWQKTYGGDKDRFNDVKIAPNGDIIVAGTTNSFGAGYLNAWVLRLDENGNVKWQKTYGESRGDWANTVAIAPNGDIIVAGTTNSFGAGYLNAWVLRLDENGNVKWQKTYGGKEIDGTNAVAVAPNGDIIVAGDTSSFGAGDRDVWVLRLDENGNVKWQKTYGGSYDDEAYAVAIAPNGDIIVAGTTKSFGAGYLNAWVLRLDGEGNVKWEKTYGGSGADWAYVVALAPNGDIIVAGWTPSFGAGKSDVWVLRLDSEGNVKWQKTYGGAGRDEANAVAVAPNGDVIVAGHTESFSTGGRRVWLLRLPPDGEIPNCSIWKDTDCVVEETHAVITDTNCSVVPTSAKPVPSTGKARAVSPKVKVLCEWHPQDEGSTLTKPAPQPVKQLSEQPEEKTKTIEGFPPALLSRYEPLEFLGEGGFAKVFKARRKEDGRIVALKIPRIDERTSGLFIKEVAAWYNLSHENIVRLYKADILPVPYLEMEFVEGVEINGKIIRDLDEYPKPVDEKTALKLIKGIALGLAHAHSKGIYHLDLKPLNVLLKADLTPKITDWGLAKISARSSLSRHYGYSPLYAAPEQLDEETFGKPDHRTDIYQLGLIFYELLTGELPYKATSPGALVGKILYGKPKPVSEIKPELKRFDGIFEKLLAKKKEERYGSVEEFLSALESLGELEREKEELKKTSLAMRKSRSREEFERLKIESIRKTVKIAILSARLNDKAELLAALDDLKFYTRENLDDLLNAITQVELLFREGIPIGSEVEERVRALVLRIEGEAVR